MSQQRELVLAGATRGPATDRPGRLHQFRRPVNQQSAEFVEWCPLATRHLVSRCSDGCRSQKLQTCDAKQPKIGLASQGTPPARRGHGARRQCQRADVGLMPFETRPHHVSGARRVAAPVPRTDSKQQRPINTQPVEEGIVLRQEQREPTHSVWRREKLRGDSKWPRAALGKEKKSNQPSARRQTPWYARHPSNRNSTWGNAAERCWTEPR